MLFCGPQFVFETSEVNTKVCLQPTCEYTEHLLRITLKYELLHRNLSANVIHSTQKQSPRSENTCKPYYKRHPLPNEKQDKNTGTRL